MNVAGKLSILTLIVVCGIPGAAQGQRAEQDQQGQQPATSAPPAPPKNPPSPLFRRHHRGIYLNDQGVEVVDATPQSPPLDTDDPGVPDKGAYEINLSTFADLSRDVQRFDLLFVDANYGILPSIAGHEIPTQVKFEVPLAATEEAGDPFRLGLGTAAFGLKFNVYHDEHTGLAASVYPQVEFAAPGTGAVGKGLAEPGQTIVLPLLVAKEFHEFVVVANAGAEAPVHDPKDEVEDEFGAGVGRAITRELAGMMEVRAESALDLKRDRLVFLNAGLMRGVGDVVLYARLGHSLFSDDRVSHTYVGVGVKLLIQP